MKSVLLVLPLAGCVFGPLASKGKNGFDPDHPTYPPPRFEDYVAHIAKEQQVYPVTKIPRSLHIEAPVELVDYGVGNKFLLSKLDAAKICILFSVAGEPHEKTAQQIANETLVLFGQRSTSFRGISSLAAETGRALFPVPNDNRARGTVDRVRIVTMQLCAPRPAITDATKFIALTYHLPDAGKPDYESILDGRNKPDPLKEETNQVERLKADVLILVAITDGSVDLTK